MKITKIYVKKLISGPEYTNFELGIEATVDETDCYHKVLDKVAREVSEGVEKLKVFHEIRETVRELSSLYNILSNRLKDAEAKFEALQNKKGEEVEEVLKKVTETIAKIEAHRVKIEEVKQFYKDKISLALPLEELERILKQMMSINLLFIGGTSIMY